MKQSCCPAPFERSGLPNSCSCRRHRLLFSDAGSEHPLRVTVRTGVTVTGEGGCHRRTRIGVQRPLEVRPSVSDRAREEISEATLVLGLGGGGPRLHGQGGDGNESERAEREREREREEGRRAKTAASIEGSRTNEGTREGEKQDRARWELVLRTLRLYGPRARKHG